MKNPRIPPGAKEPVADADGDATAAAEATDAAANNAVGAGDAAVAAAATGTTGLTTATTRGATAEAPADRAGESLRDDDAAGTPTDRDPRRSAAEEPPAADGVALDTRGPEDFPPSGTSETEPVSACATAAPPANTAPTPNVRAPAPNHA